MISVIWSIAAWCFPIEPSTPDLHVLLLLYSSVVQALRNTLCSAITEIRCLKKHNTCLREKLNLQESEWRQVEIRLQTELRLKDELLKRSRPTERPLVTSWTYLLQKKVWAEEERGTVRAGQVWSPGGESAGASSERGPVQQSDGGENMAQNGTGGDSD